MFRAKVGNVGNAPYSMVTNYTSKMVSWKMILYIYWKGADTEKDGITMPPLILTRFSLSDEEFTVSINNFAISGDFRVFL